MRYMLLIYLEETALGEAERQACYVESTELAHDLKASGKYIAASPLQPTQTMTGFIVQAFSGDIVVGSTPYLSLFAVGLLLFLMTLVLNVVSQWVVRRFREVYE